MPFFINKNVYWMNEFFVRLNNIIHNQLPFVQSFVIIIISLMSDNFCVFILNCKALAHIIPIFCKCIGF